LVRSAKITKNKEKSTVLPQANKQVSESPNLIIQSGRSDMSHPLIVG
jgi:hypothetical protein